MTFIIVSKSEVWERVKVGSKIIWKGSNSWYIEAQVTDMRRANDPISYKCNYNGSTGLARESIIAVQDNDILYCTPEYWNGISLAKLREALDASHSNDISLIVTELGDGYRAFPVARKD